MQVYEQVEAYMKEVGLKYIKNPQDFITGLAIKTDKQYAQDMAYELNSRAQGAPTDNKAFYKLKNRSLEGSIHISAAFDGGVFRHIGNMIVEEKGMQGKSVLDLCCDCGIVTCFMARCYPDSKFTGIDIDEGAIENAKKLAEKLGVTNAEFICCDVYELDLGEKFDYVTSFRSLLDAADKQTKGLNYIGYRPDREETYKGAFSDFAKSVSKHLKDGGTLISVERYTGEYGWLGWMYALSEHGINPTDRCDTMRAQDISSVKEYSVTYAVKGEGKQVLEAFNDVMSKQFKSGTGYDGAMAEFALYYDSEGEIEFYDVIKGNRIIHQFAFADSKSGKRMYYDASNDARKIKYYNVKKEESQRKDFNKKLGLYDESVYKINEYKC